MKNLVLTLIVSSLLFWSCGGKDEPKDEAGTMTYAEKTQVMTQAKQLFGPLPDKMPGSDNDTPERIELGKKLYFDNILSVNNSQSCNTCHLIDNGKAGVDNLPVSPGANKGNGTRNSPTVLNAGFQFVQFWDGREPDLKAQAKGPVLNPIEMAFKADKDVEKVLKGHAEYPGLFAKAFPGDANPVTFDNMAEAIAAFERTLISTAKFDLFCKGNAKALTDDEIMGVKNFIEVGCITCHISPLVGGSMYQKLGLVKPYPDSTDMGRYEVTKNDADKFMFKVPMLRNIALTEPYFHHGKVATLEEAITQMAEYNLSKPLTDEQLKSIMLFMHTMTGDEFTKKVSMK